MSRRWLAYALLTHGFLLLAGCPPCPKGYHQVTTPFPGTSIHVEAHDVGRSTRVDGQLIAKAGYTYVFTATGTGLLRDDGPGGKARTRSFGPNGIDGDTASAGAPVPGFNVGALVVYFGSTPYWIGAKSLPLKAPADAPITFALDVLPGTPAPGPGIANPNTIDMNFDVSVAVSFTDCVKDDQPTPPPPPPPPPMKKFSDLFSSYFAAGTAGDCANANCHGSAGKSAPYFGGTDSNAMYDWLSGKSKLTSLGDAATSRLKWCNTSGATMPLNSNPAPANACADLRAWAAQGAPK